VRKNFSWDAVSREFESILESNRLVSNPTAQEAER